MANSSLRCSRCGAPINIEKTGFLTKCGFCGKPTNPRAYYIALLPLKIFKTSFYFAENTLISSSIFLKNNIRNVYKYFIQKLSKLSQKDVSIIFVLTISGALFFVYVFAVRGFRFVNKFPFIISKTQINNIPKGWEKDTFTRYSIDCSNKNLISYQVEIYNAISPNGNDKNDFFFIKNADKYSNNSLKIFDRNGIIVYEENGYGIDDKLFYGKSNINNSNNTLPSGSYFYVFSYLDPSLQETIVKKGVLTLINN